jgi:hypothetical protein
MREMLAALSHQIWSNWMRYLLSTATRSSDGSLTIPLALAARWFRQAYTPYADLPEGEKESDRNQADKIIAVLEAEADGG